MKDNIPFSTGEIVGLCGGGILLGAFSAFYIWLLTKSFFSEILIALFSSVILFLALGFVAMFPKLLNRSETAEEEQRDCRTIRRGCITGMLIVLCGIFFAMLTATGYVGLFFYSISRAVKELF